LDWGRGVGVGTSYAGGHGDNARRDVQRIRCVVGQRPEAQWFERAGRRVEHGRKPWPSKPPSADDEGLRSAERFSRSMDVVSRDPAVPAAPYRSRRDRRLSTEDARKQWSTDVTLRSILRKRGL